MARVEWFQLWKGSQKLEQGLLVPSIEYPDLSTIPKANAKGTKSINYLQFDALILSQSCDLTGKAIELIHICPVYTLNALLTKIDDSPKARDKFFRELAQGRRTNMYITNKFTKYQFRKIKRNLPHADFDNSLNKYHVERLVADFSKSLVIPASYLKQYLRSNKTYLRLNPPYREALAQKYGLFFMRVGNPVDYLPYRDSEYK
jgi:hypothetical protein